MNYIILFPTRLGTTLRGKQVFEDIGGLNRAYEGHWKSHVFQGLNPPPAKVSTMTLNKSHKEVIV